MRELFYGRDIPKAFPKPEYRVELFSDCGFVPDELYSIRAFNYQTTPLYVFLLCFMRCYKHIRLPILIYYLGKCQLA
jgi:hypothetical protein